MKHLKTLLLITVIALSNHLYGQDSEDYLEFNDRKNVVHGVYLGFSTHYGQIENKSAYLFSTKVAYVANQQFEIGFEGVGFYSDQDFRTTGSGTRDLYGGYGGLHLEPIFFGSSQLNLSLPLLVGAGAVGYTTTNLRDTIEFGDSYISDWDPFFVVEPGVNLLYNISRYIQLELGVRYRFTSDVSLFSGGLERVDGFSTGIGVKIGVFNMGRKRYKRNI